MNTSKILRFFGYVLLISGAVSMLVPFIYMLSLSFMTDKQIFSSGISFIPHPFTAENYKYALENSNILRYFFNTIFVSLSVSAGMIITASLAGYAFSRFTFKGRELLFFLIIVSMMIPPQVNIAPLFFLMKQLHWLDTYQALIVPGIFGGFGVFMMRQWFKSQPADIEDAAKIDGCGTFGVFFRIAMPLAVPAAAALGIFTFIGIWNSFMWPLIVTNSDSLRTLPLALAEFKGSFRETAEWGALAAYSAVCSIPVIIVFLLGRRYFINDILGGGIKE